jgi:hypothetical protein
MTKDFRIENVGISGTIGTVNTWYKSTTCDLLNNTGKTPIRIDKVLAQVSGYHTCAVGSGIFMAVLHISDETGACFDADVTAGTTTLGGLEDVLQAWRDYIWITDMQVMGTGSDETNVKTVQISADTRRVLNPGQKLSFTSLFMPLSGETTKSLIAMLDANFWYSAAAL